MNNKQLPGYYGILPPSIRYNHKLSANAKLLWCELSALQSHCNRIFASNEYLGQLLGLKERQIQNLLKELKDNKLITINLKQNSRIITINNNSYGIKDKSKGNLGSNWLEDFVSNFKQNNDL